MYAPCVPVAWKSRGFRGLFPWWAFRPWCGDGAVVLLPPGRHCVQAALNCAVSGFVVSRSISIGHIFLYTFFARALVMYILWLLLSLLCHYFCYYKYTLDFRLFVVCLCVTYFSYIWFYYLIFFLPLLLSTLRVGSRQEDSSASSSSCSLQVVLFTLGRMN